jgi:transcriptional regulator with XRE-family HTH domain
MATKAAVMPYADTPIVEYLARQIEIAASMGKSQRDIARELGYERPTMISMFKRGEVKVPLDKIPVLARALNVDPAFLFRLALQQYWKEDQETIAEIFGEVCTKPERKLVQMWRKVTKGADVEPNPALERKLREWAHDSGI